MAWEQTKDSWNNTNDEVKDLVARWQEIQRKSYSYCQMLRDNISSVIYDQDKEP